MGRLIGWTLEKLLGKSPPTHKQDEEILKRIVAEWQISPELLKANWKQISGHYY
jgi:hypothetical protein